ncbi:hypothetical protein [Pedobacter heparinus]|uniref:hypothetical protein n=1 Tax=Pedobacter heparinus TaxID=984 RepID=UPI00292DFFDB|nr:hypothetical protein [Pedobacter heparinus]
MEEYIKAHRKEFDVKMPPEELWDRINAALDKEKQKKTINKPLWLGIAASLLLVLGLFLFNRHKADQQHDLTGINPAYVKKELRFASLIEEKKDSLQLYASKNPKLYARFNADLNELGNDYEALKKELPQSPNQRIVIRAMVKNLELQLQVISQQLSIINDVNQYKEENHL